MEVLLNNQNQNGIYVFDSQPNIITFSEGDYTGTPARLTITCPDGMTQGDFGVVIEINGEQIESCYSQSEATARRFAISDTGLTTANNICTALRSVSSLVTDYDIYFGRDRYGQGLVTVIAKQLAGFNLTGSCTNPYIEINTVQSTLPVSARKASVQLSSQSRYVATLDKTICSSSTNFDISPVLSSLADYGKVADVIMDTWTSDVDGNVATGRTYNFNVIKGYHLPEQPLFLTGSTLLQNVQGTLYIGAGQPLKFSWLSTTSGDIRIDFTLYSSAWEILYRDTYELEDAGQGIIDIEIPLASVMTDEVFYVSPKLPDDTIINYSVIRPSRMSEGMVRVEWRNSMGGVSFFDFTGQQTEKNGLDFDEYRDEGSAYGYYSSEKRYDRLTRNRSNDKEYTLQSHLLKKGSIGIFDDLALSDNVWIGDERIIVTNVEVTEQNNDVYLGKITYKKSRIN